MTDERKITIKIEGENIPISEVAKKLQALQECYEILGGPGKLVLSEKEEANDER